jgi:hypothetical protein
MISASHLRNHVIVPVLEHLDLDSLAAQNLLLGTAAVETEMGAYLVQIRGPALGIYQIEPLTYRDVWDHWITHRPLIRAAVTAFAGDYPCGADQLVGNLYYATAVARCIYRRDPAPLPAADDIEGLARTWKRVWNTSRGRGTVERFVEAYGRCVGAA